MTQLLLTVAGLTMAGLLSPGPNFVLITGRALSSGRTPAMATAVGVAVGSFTHALLGIAGFGALLRSSASLFTAAKLLGAAYLMWIGLKALRGSFRARRQTSVNELPAEQRRVGVRRSAIDGYLTQMSNPKSTLFFLALFTTVVPTESNLIERAAVVGTIVSLALAMYVLIAVVFSRPVLQLAYQRVGYIFDAVFGVVMIALGVRIATADR